MKAVRLTAKSNGVCGPGRNREASCHSAEPGINAGDWPRSHQRRTWQRQEHSREPAWDCTDLLRPVHRTQRATEAQASDQKAESKTCANPLRASMAHCCVIAAEQPQRQVLFFTIVSQTSLCFTIESSTLNGTLTGGIQPVKMHWKEFFSFFQPDLKVEFRVLLRSSRPGPKCSLL